MIIFLVFEISVGRLRVCLHLREELLGIGSHRRALIGSDISTSTSSVGDCSVFLLRALRGVCLLAASLTVACSLGTGRVDSVVLLGVLFGLRLLATALATARGRGTVGVCSLPLPARDLRSAVTLNVALQTTNAGLEGVAFDRLAGWLEVCGGFVPVDLGRSN